VLTDTAGWRAASPAQPAGERGARVYAYHRRRGLAFPPADRWCAGTVQV